MPFWLLFIWKVHCGLGRALSCGGLCGRKLPATLIYRDFSALTLPFLEVKTCHPEMMRELLLFFFLFFFEVKSLVPK